MIDIDKSHNCQECGEWVKTSGYNVPEYYVFAKYNEVTEGKTDAGRVKERVFFHGDCYEENEIDVNEIFND